MKKIFLVALICIMRCMAFAQIEENKFIKVTSSFEKDLSVAQDVLTTLAVDNKEKVIEKLLKIEEIRLFASAFVTEIDKGNTDYALVVVYRSFVNEKFDPNSSKTFIYHRLNSWNDTELSNYLLETKNLKFIFIDMDDKFYTENGEADRLSNTKVTIEYKESFFKESIKGLKTVLGTMSGKEGVKGADYKSKFTLVELDPKRVKAPCAIILSNKSFTSDLKFEIHEKNVASAQIGVVNSNLKLNNFSISDGTLIVTPDSTQQKEWKSNLYALIEVHLPRDMDNFQPLWKDLFGKKSFSGGKEFANRLYKITLHRVGIYGGLKISKDPLSDLYAGFNYAITKELCVNFGWAWTNEIIPQVTEIGSIASIEDAKQYAKRKYSKPNFSIGLSFSPTSVLSMLGLKEKSSD